LEFNIKIFKPISNQALSLRYAEGHRKVLADFGIENVTTNNDVWISNEFTLGIVATSVLDNSVQGGVRLHFRNPYVPLPLSQALGYLEPNLNSWLLSHPESTLAEICGLWNSKKVFGRGLSFFLTRSAVACARIHGVGRIVGLAAPYTREMSESVGFQIASELGSNGLFTYPNERHTASVMEIQDPKNVRSASVLNQLRIKSLSDHPIQTFHETYRNNRTIISYNLI
jgi:hypothetical protein